MTNHQSPQSDVFAALREIFEKRRTEGHLRTPRVVAVDLLLQRPELVALATERCATTIAMSPRGWLANQYDFFTGPRWSRTPFHGGLTKVRVGAHWAIQLDDLVGGVRSPGAVATVEPTGPEQVMREIGVLVASMADAALADPHTIELPVDAGTASRLAPTTWALFVETSFDHELPLVTNGSFLAWCGEFLAHSAGCS